MLQKSSPNKTAQQQRHLLQALQLQHSCGGIPIMYAWLHMLLPCPADIRE
jgi:hypothetical protein